MTDDEIFGVVKRRRTRTKKAEPSVRIRFEDLKHGDLVVHSDHGIGRYEGLVTLQIDGVSNDFMLIFYRDDDKLYLPVERMNAVQKYLGVDGIKPNLDKMGGRSWERVKKQVKASAEKIAGDLLKVFGLTVGRYEELEPKTPYWLETVGLGLTLWNGEFEDVPDIGHRGD